MELSTFIYILLPVILPLIVIIGIYLENKKKESSIVIKNEGELSLVSEEEEEEIVEKRGTIQQVNKPHKSYTGWFIISLILILLILILPFHYLPEKLMMFPKENLTFSNTLIFEKDIDEIVNRFNNAPLLEKQAMYQDPLYRKLREKRIIVDNQDYKNSQTKNYEYSSENNTDENVESEIYEIDARTLYLDYENNTVKSDELYKNRIIRITGEIYEIERDPDNSIYIELAKWTDQGITLEYDNIKCYFSDRDINEISQLNKGQTVTIQGTCVGKDYSSVKFKHCSIIN